MLVTIMMMITIIKKTAIRNTNMGTHNIDRKSDIFVKKDLGVKTNILGAVTIIERGQKPQLRPSLLLRLRPSLPASVCSSQLRPAPALSPASFFFRLSLRPAERGALTPTLVGGAQGGAYADGNRERSVLIPLVEIPDPGGAGRGESVALALSFA